jgi:hypothetical protein
MRHTKHYYTWNNIKNRCYRPDHKQYHAYGGRGIYMCDRWLAGFEFFWEDMGPTYRDGLQIERRNNDDGYTPENCYWATRAEQNRNKRTNRMVDTPWGTMIMRDAARQAGIRETTLRYRLNVGWPAADLFSKGRRHAT